MSYTRVLLETGSSTRKTHGSSYHPLNQDHRRYRDGVEGFDESFLSDLQESGRDRDPVLPSISDALRDTVVSQTPRFVGRVLTPDTKETPRRTLLSSWSIETFGDSSTPWYLGL